MHPQLSVQPLADFIHSRIAAAGRVTAAQFMEWALYHPDYGYYMTGPKIGPRGDFTTSPEASAAFGRLLARHATEVDGQMGKPTTFHIVECGPGRGTLASQVLDELKARHDDLYARTLYWLVEVSPALSTTQRELLSPLHGAKCQWVSDVRCLPEGVEGAVLANEFIDAFPVHVVQNSGGKLAEQYAESGKGGDFRLCPGALSDPRLAEFVRASGIALEEGERIEVNLAMGEWVEALSSKLSRGVVAVIDYGDTLPARYNEARKQGTLLGYFGGSVTHDIVANPGRQDLTALVDFTALCRVAAASGFAEVGLTRQAHFLLGLGLGTVQTVEMAGSSSADLAAILEYRRGLQALVSPEGLGRFHVALFAKGLDAARLRATLSGLKYADLL